MEKDRMELAGGELSLLHRAHELKHKWTEEKIAFILLWKKESKLL